MHCREQRVIVVERNEHVVVVDLVVNEVSRGKFPVRYHVPPELEGDALVAHCTEAITSITAGIRRLAQRELPPDAFELRLVDGQDLEWLGVTPDYPPEG